MEFYAELRTFGGQYVRFMEDLTDIETQQQQQQYTIPLMNTGWNVRHSMGGLRRMSSQGVHNCPQICGGNCQCWIPREPSSIFSRLSREIQPHPNGKFPCVSN